MTTHGKTLGLAARVGRAAAGLGLGLGVKLQ
jgi:hypothetical protein